MFRIALQYDNQAVQLWSWVELVYLFGVEATELVEKQPTKFWYVSGRGWLDQVTWSGSNIRSWTCPIISTNNMVIFNN